MDQGAVSDEELRSRTAVHRERLGFYRDASTFLRDVLIAGLILFCIARPDVVRSWLGALGVSKATFLGFELSPGSEKDLAREIDALRQQRDAAIFEKNTMAAKAADALRRVERLGGPDPSLRREIASFEASAKAATTAGPAAPAQSRLIEGAQQTLGSANGWAVVYGGNFKLDGAMTDMSWAARNGLTGRTIVRRKGVFASAVLTDSPESAQSVLDVARRLRPDAYIVNMQTWCSRTAKQDGVLECTP